MNNKLKKIFKIIVLILVLVLLFDLGLLIYTKNKKNDAKTVFNSLNSYVVSDNYYYGVGSSNSSKYEQARLVKYDSNYKEVFSKNLNTDYNSTYFNLVKDDKYLLAVGNYEKDKDENKDGVRTALFVKYDLEGNVIFKKDLQILGNSKFVNVLVLKDSYIVVGQSIYPNDILGNDKTGGAIIVKYSKKGEVIWQKNIGGNKSGLFNDVIKVDNYLYAVGKDASRYGIIVKYDLDGNMIKSVSYAKTDTYGFSQVVNYEDSLIVIGAKKLNEDDEYDHDTDGLIVKYNYDLEKESEKTYKENEKGIERFNKIIIDDDDLIVVGHEAIVDKKNSTKTSYAYYYNSFIVKYDENLKQLKSSIYNKYQDNYFTDIKLVNNNYLVSGYYKYNDNKYNTTFIEYSKDLK